ncbi:MAG: sel1 repeat family protein [Rhizobiaceae bacterium]|nr:sel1 repeat family protein [Rhizobiaceae bacterium]
MPYKFVRLSLIIFMSISFGYGAKAQAFGVPRILHQSKLPILHIAATSNNTAVEKVFQSGKEAEKNRAYSKARKFYQQAADEGHAGAMLDLGRMFSLGFGGKKNQKKAMQWYRASAKLKNPTAMNEIGTMYFGGIGIGRNLKKAQVWFSRAAAQGSRDAYFNLGLYHQHGIGMERDQKGAIDLYLKAAEKDHAQAMIALGILYNNARGENNNESNNKKAVGWYQRAADLGNLDAMVRLGIQYISGRGIERSFETGAEWFQKASDLGNVEATHQLASLIEGGIGVPKNSKKAAALVVTALKQKSKYSVTDLTGQPERWDKDFWMEFQKMMKTEGVYDGPVNGIYDSKMGVAIKNLAGQ